MTPEELAAIRELLKRPITSMERKDVIAVGVACEALLDELDALRTRTMVLDSHLDTAAKENHALRKENSLMAAHQGIDNYQRLLNENERLREALTRIETYGHDSDECPELARLALKDQPTAPAEQS